MFSNGLLLDESKIKKFKDLDISIFIPLYSDNPEIHDRITGIKGSFYLLQDNLLKLKEKKVNIKIYIPVFKENVNYLDSTIHLIKKLNMEWSIEIMKPMSIEEITQLLSDNLQSLIYTRKADLSPIDLNNYFLNKHWNSCWRFHVAILNNGDLIPCIRARDMIIGNIKKTSLYDLLIDEKIKPFWELSKDKIEKCKDCEFRYACDDCRVSAKSLGGAINSKDFFCPYNPYTSQWKSNLG